MPTVQKGEQVTFAPVHAETAFDGYCQGCGEPVKLYADLASGRLITRGHLWGERHVCADPDRRERIEITVENLLLHCPDCSTDAVALSTWGRLVEAPDESWYGQSFAGALDEHVCATERNRPAQQPINGIEVPSL